MAFALSVKSKFDLPRVGDIFLVLTLIITAFTLVYSSLFLETTLINCDVIIKDVDNAEILLLEEKKNLKFQNEENNFKQEKENAIKHDFLHENYTNENNFEKYNSFSNEVKNENLFVALKSKVLKLNDFYLLPCVDRQERISINLNLSKNDETQMENKNYNIKKDFLYK